MNFKSIYNKYPTCRISFCPDLVWFLNSTVNLMSANFYLKVILIYILDFD